MSDEWNYYKNGKQYGPVDEESLHSLVFEKEISPLSLVWSTSKNSWKSFKEHFPDAYFTLQATALQSDRPLHPAEKVALLPFPWDLDRCSLRTFMISLALALGLPALLVGYGFLTTYIPLLSSPSALNVITIIASLSSLIVFLSILIVLILALKFLYRGWHLLGPFDASLKPGLAVGLLFVPFFSAIWTKRAFYDWNKEYQALAHSKPELITAPRVFPLLFSAVPFFSIGHLILMLIFSASTSLEAAPYLGILSGSFYFLSLLTMTLACLQMAQVVNYVVSCREEAVKFKKASEPNQS